MKDENLIIIAVLGIAVVAIIASFFGGFIFGNKGQGVVFDRDEKGRIAGIFSLPNVVR